MKKERLDVLMVQRNLAESREKAKALIMSGIVYVNGQKEDKATLIIFPFFPLRSLSFSCMARPVFSLTIRLMLS